MPSHAQPRGEKHPSLRQTPTNPLTQLAPLMHREPQFPLRKKSTLWLGIRAGSNGLESIR